MLSARRKSDGETVTAYFSQKSKGPFFCLQCGDEVILRTGRSRINHFAHENPLACFQAMGESDIHRKCKMEIYEALLKHPNVRNAALEIPFSDFRPDIFAIINGVQVAIEVQISCLSLEEIQRRTIQY